MKIAIVPARGIGDALILHIASHNLQKAGWEVTTFSNPLLRFGPWFTGYRFAPSFEAEEAADALRSFDAVFLQHDNSPRARKILALSLPVYAIYGCHIPSKHGPFRKGFDFVCSFDQTMVKNMQSALEQFFGFSSKENGMHPPAGLFHRRYRRRFAIHPTSAAEEKNWTRKKFLAVAAWLEKEGYEPVFTVAPEERKDWGGPLFSDLGHLASFLYESGGFLGNDSGLGHLASYLHIPHLIIGSSKRQMELWRPGWYPGALAVPPAWLTRWKWGREHWRSLINENRVIKLLKERVL